MMMTPTRPLVEVETSTTRYSPRPQAARQVNPSSRVPQQERQPVWPMNLQCRRPHIFSKRILEALQDFAASSEALATSAQKYAKQESGARGVAPARVPTPPVGLEVPSESLHDTAMGQKAQVASSWKVWTSSGSC